MRLLDRVYYYKDGLTLEERPIKSIIEQLNKNNTYFKNERYYFVDIKNDCFVIKQRNFFLKNE